MIVENQESRAILDPYCIVIFSRAGVAADEWVKEFGGGLNFKRKKFLSLLEGIEANEIKHLLIAHRDRLVRFGFDYFQWLCDRHDCKLTVVNQEQLSPEAEMVEDLMAIVHCFSSRLHGLRSYKKKLQDVLEDNG